LSWAGISQGVARFKTGARHETIWNIGRNHENYSACEKSDVDRIYEARCFTVCIDGLST
jgi:hypothetical protein